MTKRPLPHFNPEKLRDDFRCAVCYDYGIDSTCYNDCSGYCHCGRITGLIITDVRINSMVECLFDRTEEHKDQLLKYCVHRVLSHSPARNKESWKVEVGHGYYGEEVKAVKLLKTDQTIQAINDLLKCDSDVKRVKFALEYEYDYLLDTLKNTKKASIVKVSIDSVIVPQQDHYRRLDKDVVEKYAKYSLPICVVVHITADTYRLVDGYHRLRAAHKRGAKKIEVVVLE